MRSEEKVTISTEIEIEHGGGVVGNIETRKLNLKKGSGGPNMFDSSWSALKGGEVIFRLEKPMGSFAGVFSGCNTIISHWVSFQNLLSADPDNHHDRKLFVANNCWSYFIQDQPFPRMKFSVIYNFSNRSGTLDIKRLSGGSLKEAADIPGFSWRNDLCDVVKIESIQLTAQTQMYYVNQEGSNARNGGKSNILHAGNYAGTISRNNTGELWMAIVHVDDYEKLLQGRIGPYTLGGLKFEHAICRGDIHICFDKSALNT